MIKSVAVVLGSYILSVVLVLATDPLLTLLFPGDFVRGQIPSTAPLVASTAAFFIVSIVCAVVCARFAPGRADRHVLAFLAIGELMGLGFAAGNWKNGWPHWYPLSWLVLWPLGCFIGLRLAARKAAP